MYVKQDAQNQFINGVLLIIRMKKGFEDNYRHKGLRKKLVEEVHRKGIRSEKVLAALEKVPRHLFMETGFVEFAYKDQAFPIAAGQTISQPYTVAFQTELLDVQEGDKVLEIGTGSGYQAAILIEMGARVFTVERQKELYLKVQSFLPQLGYRPRFFYGDGTEGLPSFAPFDKILITAAADSIPPALKEQLKTGGILVAPVGDATSQEMIRLMKTESGEFETTTHGYFVFVPMIRGTSNRKS